MIKTVVVPNRNAWRSHRATAALTRANGLRLLTFEQLAARLAGGFLQPIDSDSLADAVAEALIIPLGELDDIKVLPGFQRAAATTLTKVWSAGINLTAEIQTAVSPAANRRLTALAALEKEVLAKLPRNQLRPSDLATAALARVQHAPAIFGPIEIVGRTEMSPVWRPLLAQLGRTTKVTWVAEARVTPEWLPATGLAVTRREADAPTIKAVSCASPRHEMLEALRWARRLLAIGINANQIAIAAAAPQGWDDHMLAIASAANLDVHFVHGRAALDTPDGQLAAALAEVLLRGLSQTRMKRLVGLLRTWNPAFSELPTGWWRALPPDAPLLNIASWQTAIEAATPDADGPDFRAKLLELISVIGKGLEAAKDIGELVLRKRSLAIWRKALTDGPPAALDVTLRNLRVDDGLEPETSVVWGPASAVAAVPRPYTWLVGLTSRSWPRRASEDPLLPSHIIPSHRLDPLPVHQADRRDFESIKGMTSHELVCSRARRDSEGRLNGVSPLYPRTIPEAFQAQSREPEHAVSSTDRYFARPAEFDRQPSSRSALTAWINWHTDRLTEHDGVIRANHPLLLKSLERIQSASSLSKLLRNPLGYLWRYGFGWSMPSETDDPLTLDAQSFGTLLHETLQGAVGLLETQPGGFAAADSGAIKKAIEESCTAVAERWMETRPVPPPIVWQRKLDEAQGLANVALSADEQPLAGQRSWAEIPFGGDQRAKELAPEAVKALPWDPLMPVVIPRTKIHIGGSIDRLDVAGDKKAARVTDYKSGKIRSKPPQLSGGSELQRCLYAYAVKALINDSAAVEARLLYPRKGSEPLPLENPEATLEMLTGYLLAAQGYFAKGRALPGPSSGDKTDDLAFALPGGAKESYLQLIKPHVAAELADLAPLWEEP